MVAAKRCRSSCRTTRRCNKMQDLFQKILNLNFGSRLMTSGAQDLPPTHPMTRMSMMTDSFFTQIDHEDRSLCYLAPSHNCLDTAVSSAMVHSRRKRRLDHPNTTIDRPRQGSGPTAADQKGRRPPQVHQRRRMPSGSRTARARAANGATSQRSSHQYHRQGYAVP